MPRLTHFSRVALALSLALAAAHARAQGLTITPDQPSGIYDLGEPVGWTATLPEGRPAPTAPFKYVVKRNNFEVIHEGQLDLSAGPGRIEVTLDDPAMLYVTVTRPGPSSGRRVWMSVAAAVSPTRLAPAVPRPDDFDAFWDKKIRELRDVPMNAVLTPGDGGRAGVEYATVALDHVDGRVYGQIARPARAGKFPALVIFQWASPPYPLQKPWVVDRAAAGWLALNVQPHDVLPTEPQAYYDALPERIKNYASIGAADRDASYYLRMYLGDLRAVDYIATHPNWDRQTLVVMGTSMGGQQSLAVAGLHPLVTHVIVNEPAGCDLNGPLHGRQASYPFFDAGNPQVMEAARYFDAVNFAPNITATSLVAMGFLDDVAAPTGIWTAFNLIEGPKEAAPMVDSPHNHQATAQQQRPFTERSEQWLAQLVRGEVVEVQSATTGAGGVAEADQAAPAVEAVERTDPNSRLAHEQLVAKAKKGGIDVYFLGDSITRRWGTSDAAYADLLANWRENFFGWNAGNFGWGGDSTQNILWRIRNGELAGVNPKVIVLQAGTNDLPGLVRSGTSPEDAGEKVAIRIRAILIECLKHAPDATIILTAVFPRNDLPGVMPLVDAVNDNLEAMTDGSKIRLLNVNDRLADADGNLLPGMMHDRLHPTVAGYQVWADGLKPMLTELLGPPATEDHAPPPTGDPSATR